MSYNVSAIQVLEDRIGFGSDAAIDIDIVDLLQNGSSSRLYSYYHKLVSLENLYATVTPIDMDVTDFEAYLQQLVVDSVRASLTLVLDQHSRYVAENDYSDLITQKPQLFDDVIGYTLAKQGLEQMVATTRLNNEQRNANLSYQKLKVELEGITNDRGLIISKGLQGKLNKAVRKAQRVIFPIKPGINSKSVW